MSIEELRGCLRTAGGKEALDAAYKLGLMANEEANAILIESLRSPLPNVRNAAALALRDNKVQGAVPVLVEAINNPANSDNRGTLVYALEEMDCGKLFSFLFRLALDSNYECRYKALGILQSRGFWVSDKDVSEAESMLNRYVKSPVRRDDDELLFVELKDVLVDMNE